MKKFTDQELDAALKTAPIPIQKELATGYETANIISAFRSKYNLHIDTVGMIAELNRNMLLGLVNPQEFLDELIATKIPEKDAKAIITEINQKIFVPLRAEMMKSEGANAQQPIKSAPPVPSQPAGVVGPPPQSPKYFHLENKIPVPLTGIRPPAPKVVPPRPIVAPSVGGPRPVTTAPTKPGESSPLRDALAAAMKNSAPASPKATQGTAPVGEKLLEDHEEPHIELGVRNKVQGASIPAPTAPFPTPPIPTTPKPVPPPAAPKNPSADPYREPIGP